MYISFFNIF